MASSAAPRLVASQRASAKACAPAPPWRSSVAADGLTSKPYEPLNPPVAVAEQTQPTVAAAGKPDPLRRHQRPIAVLLGGLGRK